MTADLVYRRGSRVFIPSAQTTAETLQTTAVQVRSLRPAIRADFIWTSQGNNRLFQEYEEMHI